MVVPACENMSARALPGSIKRAARVACCVLVAIGLFSSTLPTRLLAQPATGTGSPKTAGSPNVVVFIADDMAWDDWGGAGNKVVRTPTLDRLAIEGMQFTNAYLTCSSCSPSRCSILTGLYPHSTGAGELHLPLDASRKLVTSYLRDAGYWTAAVGKWHLGEAVADQVDYRKGSAPQAMAQAWCAAIEACPDNKPLFLWAAHSDPHRGYQPGAVDPPHDPAKVVVSELFPDTPLVREDFALYYDEVSRFDQHVGEAVEALDAAGRLANTLVVVMSDNGRPFPHCKTRVTVPGVRTPFIVHWPQGILQPTKSDALISSVDLAPTILEVAGVALPSHMQGSSFLPALQQARASDQKLDHRQFAFAEHNWHDYRAFERAAISADYCYVRNWLPAIAGTPPADAVRSPTFIEMQRLEKLGQLTDTQREPFVAPRAAEFLFHIREDPNCTINLVESSGDLSSEAIAALESHRAALAEWMAETQDVFPGEQHLTPDGFDRTTGERIIQGVHPSLVKPKQAQKP